MRKSKGTPWEYPIVDPELYEHDYDIGDDVWFYDDGHKGQKSYGQIVHQFQLDQGPIQYVVAVKTGIDDVYVVRCGDQLSPDANGPIGMIRKLWRIFA